MLTKAATGATITVCLALLVQARHWEKKALATQVQKRQSKDEATIAELREHLSTLKAQLHSANTQNHTLTEEYEARSLSTQESIDTLSEDLLSAREEVVQHNATIAGLKEARAEDETTIADLRQQLSTLETQLLSTSAQNHTLTEENEKYGADTLSKQKSIDTLSEDLSSAREEVAQHNATITDLKKLQAKDEKTIDDLMQQLSTLRARLLSANDENLVLMEEKQEYEASSHSMQESIDTLSEDLSSARVAQHNATFTALMESQAEDESTIAGLREQLSTLETQLLSTNDENCALTKENEENEAIFHSMKESIDTLSEDLLSARGKIARRNATITELEEGQAEDKTTIADLRQRLSTSKVRLLSMNDENRALVEDNKRYKADSLFMQESINALSEDLLSARQKLAQHNATITDLKAAQAKSEAKNGQLRDKLVEVSIQNISMSNQLGGGEHLEVRRPSTESGAKGKSRGVSEGSSHAF
ncbi:hypothetical protein EST38_g9000 [Candolleomyces aberdarensis]|uniref:Uncharacterized protein n=1 Tax=Candolleomyces aberdarensis TaxID=2316362 RepID=A0A4Q2DCV3_9AGAR|nr:hypothetical protein EST38_g9000 [Candolleomyces aberdarensis]